MAYLDEDFELHMDDMSIGLQMQQFLDEWHYRVLHAGLAMTADRPQCVMAALELFQAHGISMSEQEKSVLATMDEEQMIQVIVRKMDPEQRKSLEHFCLQLQLIVSTATRVRLALEEGSPAEVARIVDEGDTGITTQILKQTIVEAGAEVAELRGIHTSWNRNMAKRIERLAELAASTEVGRLDLQRLEAEIEDFGSAQNAKTKMVLMTMVGQNDKTLTKSVFHAWFAYHAKYKSERHIHEKFQAEIDDAKAKLIHFQQDNLVSVRNAMLKSGSDQEAALQRQVVRLWAKAVRDTRREAAADKKLAAQQERLEGLQTSQKEAARKAMLQFVGGRDDTMKGLCFQTWSKHIEESRREREYEEKTKAMEGKLKAMKSKQISESKGVLSRLTVASPTGMLHQAFKAWKEDVVVDRQAREVAQTVKAQSAKFTALNAKQKENAVSAAEHAAEMEELNLMMRVFMDWHTEAKLDRVIRHYSLKMDAKKQQLEAVQHMFKNFATQLEQGISNTPRASKHRSRSSHSGSAKPPPLQ